MKIYFITVCLSFFKDILICFRKIIDLKDCYRGERYRDLSTHYRFARSDVHSGQGQARPEEGASAGFPIWVLGPKPWAIFCVSRLAAGTQTIA